MRLTELTNFGGCGCKIGVGHLDEILSDVFRDNRPINSGTILNRDDASVYRISKKKSIISSLDFFSPIVDDPYIYGRIAGANAISDIYVQGGVPKFAHVILGYPSEILALSVVKQIMLGLASIAEEADVDIVGGHTINNPQPIVGLSVTGTCKTDSVKYNSGAKPGDYIYMSKKIGGGVLLTARKNGHLKDDDIEELVTNMQILNNDTLILRKLDGVTSLTDITGFGLIGHISEIAASSNVSFNLLLNSIPVYENAREIAKLGWKTTGSKNTYKKYQQLMSNLTPQDQTLLTDPQTNGGILFTSSKKFDSDLNCQFNNKFYEIGRIGNFNISSTISSQ